MCQLHHIPSPVAVLGVLACWCTASGVQELKPPEKQCLAPFQELEGPSTVSLGAGVWERHPLATSVSEEELNLLQLGTKAEAPQDYGHPDWLRSCTAIYLDVGSNIGVQVRKLFEPAKYPDAAILPTFTRLFGEPEGRRGLASGLCALGLEPNPEHLPRLRQLERAYSARGWRIHFYPFAALDADGTMPFYVNADPTKENWNAHLEPGAAQQEKSEKQFAEVRTVDLVSFIRSLPVGTVRLMKMDIEGAEWATLARMVQKGVCCSDVIPEMVIETHPWGDTRSWKDPTDFSTIEEHVKRRHCIGGATVINRVDDESYLHDVDRDFAVDTQTRSHVDISTEVRQAVSAALATR